MVLKIYSVKEKSAIQLDEVTSDGGQNARPTWGFKKSTGGSVICRATIGGRCGFGFKVSLG
jgi:hypothetical protein